jgi:hypothetical protein
MAHASTTATVLAALSTLHSQLVEDDGFCGYAGSEEQTQELLTELWGLVESWKRQSPEELIEAWYENYLWATT